MTIIYKQRIAAVATLEALGYTFFSLRNGWTASGSVTDGNAVTSTAEADEMHAVLMACADALQGCVDGSAEEAEFKSIVDLLEAHESNRWPEGKAPGGKGRTSPRCIAQRNSCTTRGLARFTSLQAEKLAKSSR
jgi:hypothetical protein